MLQSDMERIKHTLEHIDEQAFELAVEMILNARHIYVLGVRSCSPLAEFLAFYLNLMFDNVRLIHTSSSSELLEQMVRIGKEDVMIALKFRISSVSQMCGKANHRRLTDAYCLSKPGSRKKNRFVIIICNVSSKKPLSFAQASIPFIDPIQ